MIDLIFTRDYPNAHLAILLTEAWTCHIEGEDDIWIELRQIEPEAAFKAIKKATLETAQEENFDNDIIMKQIEHPEYKQYIMGKLGLM